MILYTPRHCKHCVDLFWVNLDLLPDSYIASAKSPSIVNVREISSINIGQRPNRHKYDINLLSTGQFGSVFTIVGGYYGYDAVLKFIEEPKPKDLSKTKEEAKNLNLVSFINPSKTNAKYLELLGWSILMERSFPLWRIFPSCHERCAVQLPGTRGSPQTLS